MTKNRTDQERARTLARDWRPNVRRSAMETERRYSEFARAFVEEQVRIGAPPSSTGCYRALKSEFPDFPITQSALDKWMRTALADLYRPRAR